MTVRHWKGAAVSVRVLSVSCPVCGAEAGRPCIRPLVKADRRGQSHRERWAAYHRMKLAA